MVLTRDLSAALIFKAQKCGVANSHMHSGKLVITLSHEFPQVRVLSQCGITVAHCVLDFVEKLGRYLAAVVDSGGKSGTFWEKQVHQEIREKRQKFPGDFTYCLTMLLNRTASDSLRLSALGEHLP